jgi:chemotaxis protein CheD
LLFLCRVEIYLHPGQLEGTREPVRLGTLLGSCVAVCLWAPGEGGGMNHYLLPGAGPEGALAGKHGPSAIAGLLGRLESLGLSRNRLSAKLFGGAAPMRNSSLGQANIDVAVRTLAQEGIPVLASDVGGSRGRRISFDPHSGEVLVRML